MQSNAMTCTLPTLDQALRGGPWRECTWDDRSRRFGSAMLASLRDGLAGGEGAPAVAAGYHAGCVEIPVASSAWHETWGRVVLVWAIREVTRASHATADGPQREELLRVAGELGASSAMLCTSERAQGTLHTTPPFEHLVDTARDALVHAREGLASHTLEGGFLSAYFHQLKHIASLLAVGGHSVDSLVRGAVARTDRVVRKEGLAAWTQANLPTRQAWAQRGLVESAWALAAFVPRAHERTEHAREVSLWLARTACALAARVDRVAQWVPVVPDEGWRTQAPVVIAAPRKPTTEASQKHMSRPSLEGDEGTMDTKTNPMLKTLETDAGDAAWRLAGSQFVKLTREPIVALMSRHLAPGDESMRARIAAFLETELGASILAGLLSAGLSALPAAGGEMPQKLARELRVRAMAGAGDVIADVLMEPLRQVAVLYLQGGGTTAKEPAALPDAHEELKAAVEAVIPRNEVAVGG